MKRILLFTALLVAGSLTARADASILSPTADATIFDFNPKDGNPDFINNAGSQAFNGPFGESRALLEFDLSTLSGAISSAILDLDVVDTLGPYPMTLGIYTYAGDGSITNADFGAGSLFTTYQYSGESNLQIDLTGAISDQVNASDAFAGINIRAQDVSSINNAPYVAFHNTDDPRSALLKVNESRAVPEPASLVLLSSGMGLAGLLRRKNRG